MPAMPWRLARCCTHGRGSDRDGVFAFFTASNPGRATVVLAVVAAVAQRVRSSNNPRRRTLLRAPRSLAASRRSSQEGEQLRRMAVPSTQRQTSSRQSARIFRPRTNVSSAAKNEFSSRSLAIAAAHNGSFRGAFLTVGAPAYAILRFSAY